MVVGLVSALMLTLGLLLGPSLSTSADTNALQTLTEHCNGGSPCDKKFVRVGSLNKSSGDNALLGVTVAPGGNIWAVGYSIVSGHRRTLIERNAGSGWVRAT